jgi:hypothetical protein
MGHASGIRPADAFATARKRGMLLGFNAPENLLPDAMQAPT